VELINATEMQAGYTMGTRPDGRELLVAVVKGTFAIPQNGQESRLAADQLPLVERDIFAGEPGISAPLYEIDFAPSKPHCDVLLNGSAYAPEGKPTRRVRVSLRIGSWIKSFDVVGNRTWKSGIFQPSSTYPESFTVLPISYNNAFGGVDRSREDERKHKYFPENHAGVGYHHYLDNESLDGKPLPNTEETGKPVTKPNGNYRPMAFGPIGRAWKQRIQCAGTYDQQWIDNVFPFLPTDFNEEYYQSAPADQWIAYPKGGEEVELVNLIPRGRIIFKLPTETIPFEFFYKTGERRKFDGVIDTIFFEPDLARFTMSWRGCLPLRRSLHEIRLVVAGRVPPEGYEVPGAERRLEGKRRYRSLAELVAANQARRE
jgi:hypothetical protein